MSKAILYLCDHQYPCANNLGCELNGGECKHTHQIEHARNYYPTAVPLDLDRLFDKIPRNEYYQDNQKHIDDILYVEKETTNENTEIFS